MPLYNKFLQIEYYFFYDFQELEKKVAVVVSYLILCLILLIRKIAIPLKTANTSSACPEFPKRNWTK